MKEYLNPITGEYNTLDIQNPAPGIYAGVDHEDYLAIPAISRSLLKKFRQAPEDVIYAAEDPNKEHFIFGSQYHAYVFEPDKFEERYIKGTVTDSGRIGKAFKEEREKYGANYVYKPQWLQAYKDMYEMLLKYPKVPKILFSNNPKELTVIAKHTYTGRLLKVKIDILMFEAGWVVDLKTMASVDEKHVFYSIPRFGYDLQSGFYPYVCQLTPGLEHVNNFAMICQEKKHPYKVRSKKMHEYVGEFVVESNTLITQYDQWDRAGRPLSDDMETVPNYSMKAQ